MARKQYCETCGERHEPGQCKMEGSGGQCPHCGNTIDSKKKDGGHKRSCKVILETITWPGTSRPNPARGRVKIPAHNGPWSRPGSVYTNEVGIRVRDYTCKTCGRVATMLASDGEPTRQCPEVR